MTLPDDMRAVRVYYVMGGNSAAAEAGLVRSGYEIKSPPWNGWGTAIILGKPDAKRLTVFCPTTLSSYSVTPNATEVRDAKEVPIIPSRLADMIMKRWDEALRSELTADFGVAALVLARLGRDVPTIASHAEHARQSRSDSDTEGTEAPRKRKNKAPADRLLAPVRPDIQLGKVLRWVLANPGKSVKVAAYELDVLTHSLRSALSILNTKHGIGLTYDGDGVTATLPRGCADPFITEKEAA